MLNSQINIKRSFMRYGKTVFSVSDALKIFLNIFVSQENGVEGDKYGRNSALAETTPGEKRPVSETEIGSVVLKDVYFGFRAGLGLGALIGCQICLRVMAKFHPLPLADINLRMYNRAVRQCVIIVIISFVLLAHCLHHHWRLMPSV